MTYSSPSRTARVCRPARSEPAPGFGKQLRPDLFAPNHAGHVATLLVLRAEVQESGGADPRRHRLADRRQPVAGGLLAERLLVLGRQALAAVGRIESDAEQPGVPELDAKGSAGAGIGGITVGKPRGVLRQPGRHPGPELGDGDHRGFGGLVRTGGRTRSPRVRRGWTRCRGRLRSGNCPRSRT